MNHAVETVEAVITWNPNGGLTVTIPDLESGYAFPEMVISCTPYYVEAYFWGESDSTTRLSHINEAVKWHIERRLGMHFPKRTFKITARLAVTD
jgi:hypothetical protein